MKRRRFCLWLLFSYQFAYLACAQDASKNKQSAKDDVKIACVGDSITFGAGIKDRANNSYPSQLSGLLGAGHSVKNFGVSGTTLSKKGDRPYWTTRQFRDAIDWKPDIVVIKLGTNDTKPNNWKHEGDLAKDLKAMIATFRAQPSKPEVFLCLPVPAFPERWGIRDSVIKAELIPIIRKVAEAEKCPVIDLYKALDGKKQFFPDKIHPNKGGAEVIAKTVQAALEKQAKALKE